MSSSVWTILSNLGSQFLPRPVAVADMAVARVNRSGIVYEINERGVEVLGWNLNDRLSARLTSTIRQIGADAPSRLAVGGDSFMCIGIRAESGHEWLIIGFPAPVSDSRVLSDVTSDLDVPVARVTGAVEPLFVNDAMLAAMSSIPELQEVFESTTEASSSFGESINAARKNGWSRFQIEGEGDQLFTAKLFCHRAGDDEVFDLVGESPSRQDAAIPIAETALWHNAFLEQSPVGIVHVDKNGMVAFENHAVRQIIGEAVDEVWLGRHVLDLGVLSEEVSLDIVDMLVDGENTQWPNLRFGERIVDVHGACVRNFDGHISGVVLMLADVTSERTQSAELSLRNRFRQAQSDLRELALAVGSEQEFVDRALAILGYALNAAEVQVVTHSALTGLCRPTSGWALDRVIKLTDPFKLTSSGWLTDLAQSGTAGFLKPPIPKEIPVELQSSNAVWIPFYDSGSLGGFVIAGRQPIAFITSALQTLERELIQSLVRVFESLWTWVRVGSRYRLTVSTISDALFQYHLDAEDSTRVYSLVTEQFGSLAGLDEEGVVNRPGFWTTQLHPAIVLEDREAVDLHHARLFLGEPSVVEYRVERQSGEIAWLREKASAIERNADGVEVAGILTDVTAQKEAQLVLEEAKDDAEKSARRKGTLINTMSHELRTPIGAIQGFSDLLMAEVDAFAKRSGVELPAEIVEFAATIKDRSISLMAVLDNLFDLSQLDSGMLQVHRTKVAAGLLIQALDDFGKSLADSRVAFKLVSDFDPEREIDVDVYRLEQVVRLLLDNAFKFTERGNVILGFQERGGSLEVAVCDTGIGFDASKIELLSQPFEQGDNRLNRSFEGVGLGLSIVRQLCDAMSVEFAVTSEEGSGSRFTLLVPLEDSGSADSRPPLARSA